MTRKELSPLSWSILGTIVLILFFPVCWYLIQKLFILSNIRLPEPAAIALWAALLELVFIGLLVGLERLVKAGEKVAISLLGVILILAGIGWVMMLVIGDLLSPEPHQAGWECLGTLFLALLGIFLLRVSRKDLNQNRG